MIRSRIVVVAAVVLGSVFVPSCSKADSWADFVVSYSPGTNPAAGYTNSAVVLGPPTASATITAPAFSNSQILSLGAGGSLVVGFNTPILNNTNDPDGVNFIIFNNSFFVLSGGTISGLFDHPGLQVWVSEDNTNYYQLVETNQVGELFPTEGNGNPTLPVNPGLTLSSFTGASASNALTLYAGSAGGAPFSISDAVDSNGNPVALSEISYVKVLNTSAAAGEIDAFAAVAPVPEPTTLTLVGFGLSLLVFQRRRSQRALKRQHSRAFSVALAVLCGTALIACRTAVADSLSDSFTTDPFNTWAFGVGDNSNNQFTWNSSAPPTDAGDPAGELDVSLNSSLPSAVFERPLGFTLTDTNSFTLSTTFSFNILSAPGDQEMQIAFGLVNSGSTGGDRTGSPSNYSSDDTYNSLEFDYFPNVSTLYGGPTLTPTVFGSTNGPGADAFGNFASIFGDASNLGTHTNGITALPQNVTLQSVLNYNGATKTLGLTVSQVNSNGSLTLLETGNLTLDLVANGYNSNFPFTVDALAVMAYNDGFTTTNEPSLVANVQFQNFTLVTVPEPSALLLAGLGILGLGFTVVRRQQS